MHDTIWGGKPQKLCFDDGVPKGMKQVLEERGIITRTLHTTDMRIILANHKDFRTEKTIVEQYITSRGYTMLFIPKFHCELNPIECVLGQAKVYTWVNKNYTLPNKNYTLPRLRLIINLVLNSMSVDLIRRYFGKVQNYETAYLQGKQAGRKYSATQCQLNMRV